MKVAGILSNNKALAFILKVLHLLGPKTEADLEKKPKVKVVYLIKKLNISGAIFMQILCCLGVKHCPADS